MEIKICIILLGVLVVALGEDSKHELMENNEFMGYELIQARLDYLQERFSNALERLVTSVSSNKDHIVELAANLAANNSRLSTEMDNLAHTINENQNKTEKIIDDLTTKMASDNTKLSSLFPRLEATVENNQKLIEAKILDQTKHIDAKTFELYDMIDDLKRAVNSNMEIVSQNQQSMDSRLNLTQLNVRSNEEQIKEQAANLFANNSRLSTEMDNLLHTVNECQNKTEEKITNLTEKMVANKILENQRVIPCMVPSKSGEFKLNDTFINVYCEMESFGGGWLVIQQRVDLTLKFNRIWSEYRRGFGVVGKNENYWLGNDAIHQITSSGEYELTIEFKNRTGYYFYAQYSLFQVAGEDDKYRLTLGDHSGTIPNYFSQNNNMQFTTHDMDNDNDSSRNCANGWAYGGWWYSDCGDCDLNDTRPFSRAPGFGIYSRMMIRQKEPRKSVETRD